MAVGQVDSIYNLCKYRARRILFLTPPGHPIHFIFPRLRSIQINKCNCSFQSFLQLLFFVNVITKTFSNINQFQNELREFDGFSEFLSWRSVQRNTSDLYSPPRFVQRQGKYWSIRASRSISLL